MMRKFLIMLSLILAFFFGEIALTFSDKGNSYIIENDEVAFSLRLENEYSNSPSTRVIDDNIEQFIKKWQLKGASVAITKNEELVYAKGFGFANVETKEEVKPGHLFRIASVSKLVTALAVMRLYEDGMLNLNDQVFGPNGILDTTLFIDYRDKRVEDIKIKDLLNHTAGWSKRNGDPMFNSLYISRKMKIDPAKVNIDDIIEYTLSRKLTYNPGTKYSYSNLGYAILGRIIEEKSGMPYEDYVIMNVLKPAGIHDMHIGRSFLHEKYPNEVKYYTTNKAGKAYSIDGSGKLVPKHYGGNNIPLLSAAGGWIASAPELAKLITAADGFNEQPDILKKETIDMMINPDLAGKGLFGWRGRDSYGTWWRTGYLNGSTAVVVRQQNQVNWVILLNTSTYKESRIQRYISATMFKSVNSVEKWPFLNLFMVDENILEPLAEIPESNPKL